ncbi:MAG: CRISPR-associated endonuclease Cas2 [Bryobacterales bacterium]|nr:CRISPR-associated endonuclease Cas2 [Bryobacterales bacterium]
MVGIGKAEHHLLVFYDVENDRVRNKVSEMCLGYGLDRIQFSAFLGKLNRNRRQELAMRLRNEIGDESGRIHMIPLCDDDHRDMWVLDQYRVDAEELKARTERSESPRLRVLRSEED